MRSHIACAMPSECVDMNMQVPLSAQVAEQLFDLARAFGVQPHHGFVDHHQFRVVQQGAGNDQLLFHPVGITFDQFVGGVGQIEEV